MTERYEQYKNATEPTPGHYERWNLRGAGLESLSEVEVALPEPEADQILVRHDAVGICFSDIKIINLGPNHPRLAGRNLETQPVVMGHEVALTVVKAGASLQDKFLPGQRYIIQPDVYYHGTNVSYGYRLDGGMSQYGLIGREVLEGDEGCYLLPMKESTGYVEAALVEPWACVVAAYEYPNYRAGVLDEGSTMIVSVSGSPIEGPQLQHVFGPGHQPSIIETIRNVEDMNLADVVEGRTGGRGFDDILIFGVPSPEITEQMYSCLAPRGVLNLALENSLLGPVTVDIGRIHYDQMLTVGGIVRDPADAHESYRANTRTDLKPGGAVWFIGAGGPMGQMHIQRAVLHAAPPRKIVVTDVSDERLHRVLDRFTDQADAQGIEVVVINPSALPTTDYQDLLAMHGPFDDIVNLVPAAGIVTETLPHLAEYGVYNIFAGVARGTTTQIDLGSVLAKKQRLIGTSGSSIADLRHTLDLVEDHHLNTNASLAAIGGLSAFRDGLEAVKEGRFPGKTVIFPNIEEMPLMSVDEIRIQLPGVYAKMQDGKFWTVEAEQELLREKLRETR